MTQQQIIEESNYLAIQFADADIDVRDAIKTGFQYAVNWRIDSVWHDVKERPEANRSFLYLGTYKYDNTTRFGTDTLVLDDDWEEFAYYESIKAWAYIDDLLPQGKEEK